MLSDVCRYICRVCVPPHGEKEEVCHANWGCKARQPRRPADGVLCLLCALRSASWRRREAWRMCLAAGSRRFRWDGQSRATLVRSRNPHPPIRRQACSAHTYIDMSCAALPARSRGGDRGKCLLSSSVSPAACRLPSAVCQLPRARSDPSHRATAKPSTQSMWASVYTCIAADGRIETPPRASCVGTAAGRASVVGRSTRLTSAACGMLHHPRMLLWQLGGWCVAGMRLQDGPARCSCQASQPASSQPGTGRGGHNARSSNGRRRATGRWRARAVGGEHRWKRREISPRQHGAARQRADGPPICACSAVRRRRRRRARVVPAAPALSRRPSVPASLRGVVWMHVDMFVVQSASPGQARCWTASVIHLSTRSSSTCTCMRLARSGLKPALADLRVATGRPGAKAPRGCVCAHKERRYRWALRMPAVLMGGRPQGRERRAGWRSACRTSPWWRARRPHPAAVLALFYWCARGHPRRVRGRPRERLFGVLRSTNTTGVRKSASTQPALRQTPSAAPALRVSPLGSLHLPRLGAPVAGPSRTDSRSRSQRRRAKPAEIGPKLSCQVGSPENGSAEQTGPSILCRTRHKSRRAREEVKTAALRTRRARPCFQVSEHFKPARRQLAAVGCLLPVCLPQTSNLHPPPSIHPIPFVLPVVFFFLTDSESCFSPLVRPYVGCGDEIRSRGGARREDGGPLARPPQRWRRCRCLTVRAPFGFVIRQRGDWLEQLPLFEPPWSSWPSVFLFSAARPNAHCSVHPQS